ncbi:MAG TPA: hypothetical protein VMA33_03330 [Candidatus Tectomicrobia bacterium]|jgi:hypothetical protein|nr:hypothetical protein [Candidatus Tectomicrobia bacterium]
MSISFLGAFLNYSPKVDACALPAAARPPRAPKHTLTGEMPHQLRWEWHALIGWGGF